MKKFAGMLFASIMLFSLCSCAAGKPAVEKIRLSELTADEISVYFEQAGIPIEDKIIYDEKTDENELLGRPNQYISKANFADSRVEEMDADNTIEVFLNKEDAKKRYDYIESVTSGSSLLSQYMYIADNVVVRIDNSVLPDDAAQYETVLNGLRDGVVPSVSKVE